MGRLPEFVGMQRAQIPNR